MKSKKALLWLVALAAVCLVLLVAVPRLLGGRQQQEIVRQVVDQMLTYPNEELFAVVDAPNPGGAALGQGVPSGAQETPSPLEAQFRKMYGDLFTEAAYPTFVNQRLPLKFLLLAQEQSCTISVEAFACEKWSEADGAYSWTATLAVQLPDGESQKVVQGGLGVFNDSSGQQLTSFSLTGEALEKVLLGR